MEYGYIPHADENTLYAHAANVFDHAVKLIEEHKGKPVRGVALVIVTDDPEDDDLWQAEIVVGGTTGEVAQCLGNILAGMQRAEREHKDDD